MSQKSRINRARREAQQEKKGKAIVDWILWGLVGLAAILLVYNAINA